MNRGPAILHRLTVGLIGLLCVAVGIGALLWRTSVRPVRDGIERIDTDSVSRFAAGSWWIAILVGVVVIALVWGWSLIASVIRPRHVGTDLLLEGSDEFGTLTVAPRTIASAVADELAAATIIDRSSVRVLDDRNRTIVRLTVTAAPTRDYDEVAAVLDDAVEHIREAVGESDVHVQGLIHLEYPKH